jgi:hypothetical protein
MGYDKYCRALGVHGLEKCGCVDCSLCYIDRLHILFSVAGNSECMEQNVIARTNYMSLVFLAFHYELWEKGNDIQHCEKQWRKQRLLGKHIYRFENNIKVDLKGMGWESMN